MNGKILGLLFTITTTLSSYNALTAPYSLSAINVFDTQFTGRVSHDAQVGQYVFYVSTNSSFTNLVLQYIQPVIAGTPTGSIIPSRTRHWPSYLELTPGTRYYYRYKYYYIWGGIGYTSTKSVVTSGGGGGGGGSGGGVVVPPCCPFEVDESDLKLKSSISQNLFEPIIYPNPTTDMIYLNLDDGIRNEQLDISLYNVSGSKIPISITKDYNGLSLDLTNFEPGYYILNVSDGIRNYKHRLLKN